MFGKREHDNHLVQGPLRGGVPEGSVNFVRLGDPSKNLGVGKERTMGIAEPRSPKSNASTRRCGLEQCFERNVNMMS